MLQNVSKPKAREAQRAYYKKWRAENKDRIRAYNQRYWERRASKMEQRGEQDAEANAKP